MGGKRHVYSVILVALALTASACAGRAHESANPATDPEALTAADARRLADAYRAQLAGAAVVFDHVVETETEFEVHYRDPEACAPGQQLESPPRELKARSTATTRVFTFDMCPTSGGSRGTVVHVRKVDGEARVDFID